MANFSTQVITNVGLQAVATIAGGTAATITRVQVGKGKLTGQDPTLLTALITPVMNATLIGQNNLTPEELNIRWQIDPTEVTSQFTLNEYGVFMTCPGVNGGSEFLFAYASAGNTGDVITPSSSNNGVVNQYNTAFEFSNASSISMSLATYPQVNLHAATHLDNGDDPISVATTSRTGSMAKLSGHRYDTFRGDGTWGSGWAAGMSMEWNGPSAPAGRWLLEDGSSYSTATYPDLFAAIGYTWGGSGSSFNVPDSRGKVTVAAGQGSGLTNRILAAIGGEETHVLTQGQMPNHIHGISNSYPFNNQYQFQAGSSYVALTGDPPDISVGNVSSGPNQTQATGGGAAHNNMQPFIVKSKYICY